MADAGTTSFLQSIAPLVEKIKTDYPSLLPYLQDPEIAEIILEGAANNDTPTAFQAAIQGSKWYTSKAPSERQWIVTKLVDPGRASQLEAQTSVQIRQLASTYGIPLTSAQVDYFTTGALDGGWDANEIQRQVVNYGSTRQLRPGQITATQDQLRATASSYAIPVSDQALKSWATQINDGNQTTQGFQSYAAQQAKLAFPGLEKQIDSGLTVKQIGDPYAQIAAQQLGIDPNTIDFSDPKWHAALQGQDANGNPAGPLTHLQWQQKILVDPTYGFASSQQGLSDAYNLKQSIMQSFGTQVV